MTCWLELYRYVMTRLTFDWLGAFQTKKLEVLASTTTICVSDPIIHLTVDVLILQLLGFFFFKCCCSTDVPSYISSNPHHVNHDLIESRIRRL